MRVEGLGREGREGRRGSDRVRTGESKQADSRRERKHNKHNPTTDKDRIGGKHTRLVNALKIAGMEAFYSRQTTCEDRLPRDGPYGGRMRWETDETAYLPGYLPPLNGDLNVIIYPRSRCHSSAGKYVRALERVVRDEEGRTQHATHRTSTSCHKLL